MNHKFSKIKKRKKIKKIWRCRLPPPSAACRPLLLSHRPAAALPAARRRQPICFPLPSHPLATALPSACWCALPSRGSWRAAVHHRPPPRTTTRRYPPCTMKRAGKGRRRSRRGEGRGKLPRRGPGTGRGVDRGELWIEGRSSGGGGERVDKDGRRARCV